MNSGLEMFTRQEANSPILVLDVRDSRLAVQRLLVHTSPVGSIPRRALLGEWESLVDQVSAAFLVHRERNAFAVDFQYLLRLIVYRKKKKNRENLASFFPNFHPNTPQLPRTSIKT
jgi:hypothetical protein